MQPQYTFGFVIKPLALILILTQLTLELNASPQQASPADPNDRLNCAINSILAMKECERMQEADIRRCDEAYCEGLSRLSDPSQTDPAGAIEQLWQEYQSCLNVARHDADLCQRSVIAAYNCDLTYGRNDTPPRVSPRSREKETHPRETAQPVCSILTLSDE
jgi:hypothetical protein